MYRAAVKLWETAGSDSVVDVLLPWEIRVEALIGKLFCWGNMGGGLTRA